MPPVPPSHGCKSAYPPISEVNNKTLIEKTEQMALSAKGKVQRIAANFISAPEAQVLSKAGKVTLVDVRDHDDFNRFHLPHSINVPISQLGAKSFLRNRSLVLVHEGYADAQLESLIKRLTQLGFSSVKVLDGGLNAWRQRIGSLEGDVLAQRRLNRLSAQAFLAQKKYDHWRVLEFGDISTKREQLRQHLLKLKQAASSSKDKRFLIVTPSGEGYDLIERVVNELGWYDIYYLIGGKQAYEQQVKLYIAMLNRTPGKQGDVNRCGGRL